MEEAQTETQEAIGAVLGDVAEDTNEADAEAAAELQEAYAEALSGEGVAVPPEVVFVADVEALSVALPAAGAEDRPWDVVAEFELVCPDS
jgi:hypothetical protein